MGTLGGNFSVVTSLGQFDASVKRVSSVYSSLGQFDASLERVSSVRIGTSLARLG